MDRPKATFYPGEYHDFEQEFVDKINSQLEGTGAPDSMLPPGMDLPFEMPKAEPFTEEEILTYNKRWNPYDPLYTDPEYAKAHGHPGVPAFPGFGDIRGGNTGKPAPYVNFRMMFDSFCYTNDGCAYEYERNIYPGDLITGNGGQNTFTDVTAPGSNTRIWERRSVGYGVDQNGMPIVRREEAIREGYMKFTDGGPALTISESLDRWIKTLKPAHYTTDEEWDYIRRLWDEEVINGDNTPYWEDVQIGQELPKTCSDGPITYMSMIALQNIGERSAYGRNELRQKEWLKSQYRDANGSYFNDTYLHYGNRNVPEARALFYNDTAARLVARVLTNFVGTKGRVSKFSWVLCPFTKDLETTELCRSMFNKVPGMEGKYVNRHGTDGDLVIGRAVITDKYINAKGEHCCEVALWAEDLEGNILQGCPSEIVLPAKV